MKFKILLVALMLFSLGWSLDVMEYLNYNESTGDVALVDMIGPNGIYTAYYLDSKLLFIIYDDEIVEDKGVIKKVIERHYFEKDFFRVSELEEIQETILAFNDSRRNDFSEGRIKNPPNNPPENYCRQITGTLFRECYDKQSCLLSCISVPVCKDALEGIPQKEEFISDVYNLQEDSKKLSNYTLRIIEISEKFKNVKYENYNDEVKEEIVEIITMMGEIRKIGNSVRSNFLFSDLLPAPGLQSYCAPVNYSKEVESELTVLANKYDSKLKNLFNIDEYVDEILNESMYRKDLKVILKTENEYTGKYNKIDKDYEEIYSKYVKVNKYINDVELKNDMNLLKKYLDSARDNIYLNEFNKADLNIRQYEVLTKKYAERIDVYYEDVNEIEMLQTKINKKFILAEWDIQGVFFQLGPQLNELKTKKNEIDKKVGMRIKPEEVEEIKSEYEFIHNEVTDIIKVKREQLLDTALTSIVVKSNDYSNMFSSMLGATGMEYESRKSVREYIFPVTLILGSLFVVGSFMFSFVYLVSKGRIRLHRIAAMLWSLIFISFFITVSGGAVASYLIINEKSVKSTFDTFYTGVLEGESVAIVLDERKGEINVECANRLSNVFENQMNKTVIYYKINHNECYQMESLDGRITPEVLTHSECEERMDAFTKVKIVKGEESLTTFKLKYVPEAVIEGDNNYINSCELAIILNEEI